MKNYTANCVYSNAESIHRMCDDATEIEYKQFIQQIDINQLKILFPNYNWADDKTEDLKLADDWAVSFWQSEFMGTPCLYVEHSRIEYIFC